MIDFTLFAETWIAYSFAMSWGLALAMCVDLLYRFKNW